MRPLDQADPALRNGEIRHGTQTASSKGVSQSDIGIVSADGAAGRQLLLADDFNETAPDVSPNGHWLAYSSDESGLRDLRQRCEREATSLNHPHTRTGQMRTEILS